MDSRKLSPKSGITKLENRGLGKVALAQTVGSNTPSRREILLADRAAMLKRLFRGGSSEKKTCFGREYSELNHYHGINRRVPALPGTERPAYL